MSPLFTHPSSTQSPQIDTPEAPDTAHLYILIYISAADCLATEGNLPGFRLTEADNDLFDIYQDWVHQKPGIQLDGGIDVGCKWQAV